MLMKDKIRVTPHQRAGIDLNGGKISGITTEKSKPIQAIVCLYCRESGQLISSILSKKDGSYSFIKLSKKNSFSILALHVSKLFNAVIQDNVVPK